MVGKVKIAPAKSKVLAEVAALTEERNRLIADLEAAQQEAACWRQAVDVERAGIKDKIALAALTGMLSHGTHHTPDKVMVMVYEFAEAGMNARVNNPERERCAGIVEMLVNTIATDPHPTAECSTRYVSDALERIRSGR